MSPASIEMVFFFSSLVFQVYQGVLVLAGTVFIFFTVAGMGLCFVCWFCVVGQCLFSSQSLVSGCVLDFC